MAALTVPRSTPQRGTEPKQRVICHGVKASVKCIQGGLAVLNAGYLAPATAAAGLVAVGRFKRTVDNSSGSSGDLKAEVELGTFRWANSSSGDEITAAHVGRLCYAVDDQTVALTDGGAGGRSVAGKIIDVDSNGVWVESGMDVPAALTGATVGTVADNNTAGGVELTHVVVVPDGATGDVDVVLDHKSEVIDVTVVKTAGAGGASDTITVKNGATAITNAMDINVADKTVVRAGTIDDASFVIAAAGTLRVTRTKASGANVACRVYVKVIRKA